MPDYKTPTQNQPLNKKRFFTLLGLVIIILGLGYLVWGGKISFKKASQQAGESVNKPSASSTVNNPGAQPAIPKPYTTKFPQALIVEPVLRQSIQMLTGPKTITQTIEYDSTNSPEVALDLYKTSLEKNDWTVDKFSPAPAFSLSAHNNDAKVNIHIKTSEPNAPHVTIVYEVPNK